MSKAKIEQEIAQLQKVYDDPKTPADVKKTLGAALENAKKHLAAAAGETKTSAKKITSTHKGEKSLADCREIIKKYEGEKHTEKKRVEKRVAAGKPEKLTPAETIKKAAKSVAKKVEEKPPTKTDVNAAIKQISDLALSLAKGIDNKEGRNNFFKQLRGLFEWYLINFDEHVGAKKAAKGMHVASGKGETWHPDAQINVYGYKTENFTYDAKEYFEELMGDESVTAHAKADVVAMARDFDEVLGVYRKEVQNSDGIYQGDYIASIRYLMRGMYYSYPATTQAGLAAAIYPSFITTYMYRIARKLKTDLTADAGLHVVTGTKFAEGGKVEDANIYTDDRDKAEDIRSWLNLGVSNKFVYDVREQKEDGKTVYAIVRKSKMAKGGPVEEIKNGSVVVYKEPMADEGEMDYTVIEISPTENWAKIQANAGMNINPTYTADITELKLVDKKMFGGVVNVAAIDNLAAKDNGGEQFLAPSFAKGGPVKKGSKKAKPAKGTTFKKKENAIAKSLRGKKVPAKYKKEYGKTYGAVTSRIAAQKIAGSIVKKENRKMFGGVVNVAAVDNLAAKDNGGEQFLAPSV